MSTNLFCQHLKLYKFQHNLFWTFPSLDLVPSLCHLMPKDQTRVLSLRVISHWEWKLTGIRPVLPSLFLRRVESRDYLSHSCHFWYWLMPSVYLTVFLSDGNKSVASVVICHMIRKQLYKAMNKFKWKEQEENEHIPPSKWVEWQVIIHMFTFFAA